MYLKIIVIIVVIITSNYVELSIKMRENTKGSTVIQLSLRNPNRVFATKKSNNNFNFCNQMKNIETSKVFPSLSEIISLCLNVTKTDEVFIRAVGMERLPLLEVWSTTWHWTFQLHLFVGALFWIWPTLCFGIIHNIPRYVGQPWNQQNPRSLLYNFTFVFSSEKCWVLVKYLNKIVQMI